MGTTPNFGWTYPAPTNYVKDLPSDLGDLADEIDATVAGLGSGLNYINGSTFTAQSAVQIDNCFTSTYDNYLVLFTITATGTSSDINFTVKYVDGTTPSTGSLYSYAANGWTSSGLNENINASATSNWRFGSVSNTYPWHSARLEIFNPNKASYTNATWQSINSYSTGRFYSNSGSSTYEANTAYEGIQISASTSTMTGIVRVYGYENS